MSAAQKLTPMMQQYFEVKRALPKGAILLFRLGDFYEIFYEDAEIASRVCGLTLTKRQDYPMAGMPHHAVDNYIPKLLAAGHKVAICDQAEPAQAGKLVKRALTRILSPGTTLDANQLDASRNHYLCALTRDKHGLHAAWLDLSTGEFQLATDRRADNLLPVLTALEPAELLLIEGDADEWRHAKHEDTDALALRDFCHGRIVTELPGYHFETTSGARTVLDALGVLNLEGFGLDEKHPGLGPAGALVYYATENLCAKPENLRGLREYRSATTLLIDPATLRNLEIFQSSRGTRAGSLLAAINRCSTAAGARLLERWLSAPVLDLTEIRRRSATVGELLAEPMLLGELRETLAHIRDIPRILGRLQNRLRNPRELGGVRDTLLQIPDVHRLLADFGQTLGCDYPARIDELPQLRDLLQRALADEMPNDIAEGGAIREGFDAELDRIRSLTRDNKTWLSELESAEQVQRKRNEQRRDTQVEPGVGRKLVQS